MLTQAAIPCLERKEKLEIGPVKPYANMAEANKASTRV